MNYTAVILFVVIGILVEWGAYVAFRGWAQDNSIYFWIYVVFTLASYALLMSFLFVSREWRYPILNMFVIIFLGKLLVTLFLGIGLTGAQVSQWISPNEPPVLESRRLFVKKLTALVGLVPIGLMTWGIFRTAGNFKIHTVKLTLKGLPDAFKGFKIVQVSDIHTGSFFSKERMREAVSEVLDQKADIVIFSGDLVNNRTDEAYDYMDILGQIKAPLGVYSTLGNHDYGDYENWPTAEDKVKNFQDMLDVHKKLGWNLLMNEHRVFERNGEKIALLGVENWGANLRFPKYGKMNLAYPGTEDIPVKILISHDPSHWEAEVLKDYPDIQLMMAGHTHGFQFGVEIPGIKWSPSQWVYKQWAGLYENEGRYLYVNRGLGCIGYMGRVGIRPEITVFELV